MNQQMRTKLESYGYTFEQRIWNHKVYTYIIHPDGQSFKYFDHLSQIQPTDLYDGEEFDLSEYALPSEVRYEGVMSFNNEYEQELTVPRYDANTGQLIGWITIAIIIAVLSILIGLIHAIAQFFEKINAPCGVNGSILEINDCWKLIIRPDCASRPFNCCAGDDLNGDGYPDGEWEEGSDWEKIDQWAEIIKWGLIAGLGLVGIYVLLTLVKKPRQFYIPSFSRTAPPKSNRRTNNNHRHEDLGTME